MNNLEGALCVGQHWMFDSTDIRDHWAAKELCAECPVLRNCAILLREVQDATKGTRNAGGGPCGTWAGKLLSGGRANPREHGSDRGYHQHRYAADAICDPCRLAHNAAVRKPKERVA